MKKLFALLLTLGFLIPFLYGCEEDKFWETTYATLESLTIADYEEYMGVTDLTYSEKITTAIDVSTTEFAILTEYQNILNSCVTSIKKLYGTFQTAPLEPTSKMKSSHNDLIKEIEDYKEAIITFRNEKTKFENNIALLNIAGSLANSPSANQLLIEYKYDFYDLIISANQLDQAFIEAFSQTYFAVSADEQAIASITSFQFEAGVCIALSSISNSYITWLEENEKLLPEKKFDGLETLITNINQNSLSTNGYGEWVELYFNHKAENEMFQKAIDKVNYKEFSTLFSGDISLYAQENPIFKAYILKIQKYLEAYSSSFIQATISLF